MGALLEGVEALNSPMGIIILVIVVAAAYLWYRWLFTEPKEPESKQRQLCYVHIVANRL